jgi:hypothetical protein
MITVSHICNFMKFQGYHLCLAVMGDSYYSASFTKGEPKMPDKLDGCGTYQAAIMHEANKIFEADPEIAKKWAIETLKCLYKDKG